MKNLLFFFKGFIGQLSLSLVVILTLLSFFIVNTYQKINLFVVVSEEVIHPLHEIPHPLLVINRSFQEEQSLLLLSEQKLLTAGEIESKLGTIEKDEEEALLKLKSFDRDYVSLLANFGSAENKQKFQIIKNTISDVVDFRHEYEVLVDGYFVAKDKGDLVTREKLIRETNERLVIFSDKLKADEEIMEDLSQDLNANLVKMINELTQRIILYAVVIFVIVILSIGNSIVQSFTLSKILLKSFKEIENGNLSFRIKEIEGSEYNFVILFFNKMTAKLQSLLSNLKTANEALESKNVELQKTSEELTKMNKLMVDRELKMIELKKEIADLRLSTTSRSTPNHKPAA